MTYSSSELIERLRDAPKIATEDRRLCAEAAGRIAELEREVQAHRKYTGRHDEALYLLSILKAHTYRNYRTNEWCFDVGVVDAHEWKVLMDWLKSCEEAHSEQ